MTYRSIAAFAVFVGLLGSAGSQAQEDARETDLDNFLADIEHAQRVDDHLGAHAQEEEVDAWKEARLGRTEADVAHLKAFEEGVTTSANWVSVGLQGFASFKELTESYKALSAGDGGCIDVSSAGAPDMPSSCADSPKCEACYEDALRRLDRMRLNLERLRCVYRTWKAYNDAAIAFGDSASGIHAVTGMAWQVERVKILKAAKETDAAYDRKYAEMLPNLERALEALGECEFKNFGERDWYTRFGFLYYAFMADRYRRD